MESTQMVKPQSASSIKREQRRNNPDTIKFREEILLLLEHAEPDVAYSIKRDLSTMIDMPFYKEAKSKVKSEKSKLEMIKSYAELLLNNSDKTFATKLLKELSKNQGQTIRKVAPKFGEKKDIWEHVIPTKFITNVIIEMIKNKDLSKIDTLLNIYVKGGQRSVTNEENQLLMKYHSCMPDGWDWDKSDADHLIRHRITGIIK